MFKKLYLINVHDAAAAAVRRALKSGASRWVLYSTSICILLLNTSCLRDIFITINYYITMRFSVETEFRIIYNNMFQCSLDKGVPV